VGDRVANIVEDRTEWALEIQLRRQDAVEVVHDVVVEEQGENVLKTIFSKEQRERKDSEN
jgi:hypothetical protein